MASSSTHACPECGGFHKGECAEAVIEVKTLQTYTATIYVGMREQYTSNVRSIDTARDFLRQYVKCGLCVTLTPTEYIYTDGGEPGFIVGLISYPRFPCRPSEIRHHAVAIAEALMNLYYQFRVTIVLPDETVMVESK